MANLNPVTKSDYRDHKEPKVKTRDLLLYVVKENIDKEFTAHDLTESFMLAQADAASRLGKLKGWGCLRTIEKGRGQNPHVWQVTDWGYEMAKRWKIKREEEVIVDDHK